LEERPAWEKETKLREKNHQCRRVPRNLSKLFGRKVGREPDSPKTCSGGKKEKG